MKNKKIKNKLYHYKKVYFTITLLANIFLAKLAYAAWNFGVHNGNVNVDVGGGGGAGDYGGGWDVNSLGDFGLPDASIYSIIANILDWLLAIIGIVGIIGFAIAGILYLTSAGNEDRMTTAKRAMIYSIIGVIVALSGLVVLYFADNLLNASFF